MPYPFWPHDPLIWDLLLWHVTKISTEFELLFYRNSWGKLIACLLLMQHFHEVICEHLLYSKAIAAPNVKKNYRSTHLVILNQTNYWSTNLLFEILRSCAGNLAKLSKLKPKIRNVHFFQPQCRLRRNLKNCAYKNNTIFKNWNIFQIGDCACLWVQLVFILNTYKYY